MITVRKPSAEELKNNASRMRESMARLRERFLKHKINIVKPEEKDENEK